MARRVVSARNAAFRVVPKFFAQNTLARGASKRPCVVRALVSRVRYSKRAFKPRIRAFGFLNKTPGVLATPKYAATYLKAEAALNRQDRRYRELQFYHNRPRMRLPQTRVTRGRRRKAGLVTFVRNSLQQATSLLGKSRTLLPPVNVYSRVTAKHAVGFAPTATSLAAYERRDGLLPVF